MALINCNECGNQISDKASACPKCGNPVNNIQSKEQKTETRNTPHPKIENTTQQNQHKETEVIYYSDNGVRVTSTRFIVDSITFPLQGITSIRAIHIPVSKTASIILFVVGLIMFFAGFGTNNGGGLIILGFILAAIAVYWFNILKDDYGVQITTSAGESKPLVSKNQKYIENVTRALNEAIIHRG
jgi:hypothetical protein